jgi:redox-sensitive bicupin YhaK (pirin superfamily)
MWVGRLPAGRTVAVPDAPFVHVFVARGEVELDGRGLGEGDAARITDAGALDLTAMADSEVIVWESARQVA